MHEWKPVVTGRYQDHVLAHVEGASVLGYFVMDDAAYVLLDIALIWTIYASCEMALMPQRVVISDLEVEETVKAELLADIEHLHGGRAETLSRMHQTPAECTVREVRLYAEGERRRVVIEGEPSSLALESSLETGGIDSGSLGAKSGRAPASD